MTARPRDLLYAMIVLAIALIGIVFQWLKGAYDNA